MKDLQELDKEDCSWMRERFIFMQTNLKGLKAKIAMHGHTIVDGTWQTTDGNFENLIVKNLHTPRPETIPEAVLRMTDIISITISH